MKKMIFPIVALATVTIVACSKVEDETNSNSEVISVSLQKSTLTLSSRYELMIQHGILSLASNSQVISKYYAHSTENGHDEALLLSELETLTDGRVNLKNLMTIGVTNHFGSTQANIDYFSQLYDSMKDNLLIYAPLSDVYSHNSIGAAFFTESSTSMNRIDRVYGQVVTSSIDVNYGPASALWMGVYLDTVDGGDLPGGGDRGLPWHRCYCSRDSQVEIGGVIYTLTYGTCDLTRRQENCGMCGRATFHGDCPGTSCPGC